MPPPTQILKTGLVKQKTKSDGEISRMPLYELFDSIQHIYLFSKDDEFSLFKGYEGKYEY